MSVQTCQLCGSEMARGRATIKKSWLAWLAWPFERDRLEFITDRAPGVVEIIIRQDTDYEAFQCTQCGALLLTQNRWAVEEVL